MSIYPPVVQSGLQEKKSYSKNYSYQNQQTKFILYIFHMKKKYTSTTITIFEFEMEDSLASSSVAIVNPGMNDISDVEHEWTEGNNVVREFDWNN